MKGYDVFFEAPGMVDKRSCQVCGAECYVKRDQIGPTSWASAVTKADVPHDHFYCPHSGQPWHEQALALIQAIESTPSKRVAALMQQDLVELRTGHGLIPGK